MGCGPSITDAGEYSPKYNANRAQSGNEKRRNARGVFKYAKPPSGSQYDHTARVWKTPNYKPK